MWRTPYIAGIAPSCFARPTRGVTLGSFGICMSECRDAHKVGALRNDVDRARTGPPD